MWDKKKTWNVSRKYLLKKNYKWPPNITVLFPLSYVQLYEFALCFPKLQKKYILVVKV